MRRLWVWREIEAPTAVVWDLLTDIDRWPVWGPSVRSAALDTGVLGIGATGTVTTAVGARLSFEVTTFHAGERWGWRVAGVEATDHVVQPRGATRCRVGFGVPWPAAPYLAVCAVAMRRLDRLAAAEVTVT